MNNPNNSVFLHKISEKIKRGDYDKYFTIPFMTKELLITSIKVKLTKKIAKNTTPILTDSEVMICIQEVKETAIEVFLAYLKNGIIEKTEDGYKISDKGKIALKQTTTLFMEK